MADKWPDNSKYQSLSTYAIPTVSMAPGEQLYYFHGIGLLAAMIYDLASQNFQP